MPPRCFKTKKYLLLKAAFRCGICLVFALACIKTLADESHLRGNKGNVSFEARLQKWVSITSLSDRSGLREVCERLSKSHRIAIVIDRNLDPHRPVTLSAPIDGSVAQVLNQIAVNQNAQLRELGNALLVLSENPAEKLKTVVALRTEELKTTTAKKKAAFRYNTHTIRRIMNRHPWQWNDLSRPRELVLEAAEKKGLQVKKSELIPHDLWYHGELPHAHLMEFLCFVLIQYDLTFSWDDENSIEIVRIPERVTIERKYKRAKKIIEEHRKKLIKKFPQSRWEQQQGYVTVSGPIELHDELKALLSNKKAKSTSSRIPWKQKRYTMRVVRKPLGEVLKFLDASGVPIQYDREQIESTGISFDQLISFETEQADAKELMQAICKPIDLPFHVSEQGIELGKHKK